MSSYIRIKFILWTSMLDLSAADADDNWWCYNHHCRHLWTRVQILCVKFVRCNLKTLHHRILCNCWPLNNSFRLCRYVYDPHTKFPKNHQLSPWNRKLNIDIMQPCCSFVCNKILHQQKAHIFPSTITILHFWPPHYVELGSLPPHKTERERETLLTRLLLVVEN